MVSAEAQALIDDHLEKIRTIIKEVMEKKGVNAVGADASGGEASNSPGMILDRRPFFQGGFSSCRMP